MSASDVIARLRETHKRWVNFDLSMLNEEAEIARSLPALLECAEALEKIAHLTRYAPKISAEREIHDMANAALNALSKDTP